MGGKQMEGNEEQRRRAAREAREEGKKPSAVGATLGASKQRTEADGSMTHQQRLDLKREGKSSGVEAPGARPGSRDPDTADRDDPRL